MQSKLFVNVTKLAVISFYLTSGGWYRSLRQVAETLRIVIKNFKIVNLDFREF